MYGKSDVLINRVLLDRILQIKQNNFLNRESIKTLEDELLEEIKLTRLGEMAESLTEDEAIVLILIIIQNYPDLVFQILAEEYLLNKERADKNDRNSNR